MVHVGLDELKGLVLNHLHGLRVELVAQLLDLVTAQAFALLVGFLKCLANDCLDISETLYALPHTQAEVSEPLVVEGDGPVLAQELNGVGNDVVVIAICQLIEVVLVESNETPETLQNDLFITHVGHRVNQPNVVEGELDEVALSSGGV